MRVVVLITGAMLMLLAVFLLGACGGAKTRSDPLVGTWQTGDGTQLVIGRSGDSYTGAWVATDTNPPMVPFTRVRREGLSLFAKVPDSIFGPAQLLITYIPATGKLIVTDRAHAKDSGAFQMTLTRFSTATALP